MAQSKIDFSSMSSEELAEEIQRMELEYQRSQFDHAVQGLSNPLELREMRRNIARALTDARRREVAVMTPEELANRSKTRARRRR